MRYALIEDGIIVNVIVLHPMNADDFPQAVPLPDGLSIGIGDVYLDGEFYRNGEKIVSASAEMAAEMEDMRAALMNLGVTTSE